MHKYVLLTAGGIGSRMHTSTPKQFLEIAGKPLLMYSLEAFLQYDRHLRFVVVLPEEHTHFWKDTCREHHFAYPHQVVQGGPTRFHSVQNGLKHVPNDTLVAVHDGVRPLVSVPTIARVFASAEKYGNAVPCVNPKESIRMMEKEGSRPLNREKVRIVQTPQAFHTNLLKKAYEKEYSDQFSDDASLLESTGIVINLVEGNYENLKITTPEDLVLAEALLKIRS